MASIKNDKESKERQEKYQTILCALLRDDDNKYCVDCDAKGPRWASWNLGIFLCIRCAGIHRNLGVHISKVKSVTLDSWTAEQIAMVQEMGNSRARAVYEANLPDNFRRPQTDSGLEAFIRAKYELKKYIAAEWVPPKPRLQPIVAEEANKEKKVRPRTVASTTPVPVRTTETTRSSSATVPPPITAEAHRPRTDIASHHAPITAAAVVQAKAPEIDLLGLDAPVPVSNSSNDDLFNDFLSCSMAAPSSSSSAPGSLPQSSAGGLGGADLTSDPGLFDGGVGGAEQKKGSTKDAIMALYGPQAPAGYGPAPGMYGPAAGGYGPTPGPNPYASVGGAGMYMMQPGQGGMPMQMVGGGMAMQPGMGVGGMTQQQMYSMQQQQQQQLMAAGMQPNQQQMYNMQQLQNQMLQMNMMNGATPAGYAPNNMAAVGGAQAAYGGRIPQAGPQMGSWGGMTAPQPTTGYPPVVAANIWQ